MSSRSVEIIQFINYSVRHVNVLPSPKFLLLGNLIQCTNNMPANIKFKKKKNGVLCSRWTRMIICVWLALCMFNFYFKFNLVLVKVL